jgi:hypothetical protein
MLDRFRVSTAVVRMQPRRNARTGGGAMGGASWLVSSWGGGLAGRGEGWGGGGGGINRPSVIRVGQAFQAVVPPWTGPLPLDGSAAAPAPAAAVAAAPSPTAASAASGDERAAVMKKSARVEERGAAAAAAADALPAARPTSKPRPPPESEPARAERLAGIKMWPPVEAPGRLTRGYVAAYGGGGGGGSGSQRASLGAAKVDLRRRSASDGAARGDGSPGVAANDCKRPAEIGEGSAEGATKRARVYTEKEKDEDDRAGLKAALAAIPANPSVKAAAAARAAAAAARAMVGLYTLNAVYP